MALLDQYGEPIKLSSLTKPVAGPDLVGMRPAVSPVAFAGLDPVVLGEAMAAADQGDSLQWQTIAELIEERDAHYQGVLGTRKRSVGQLPITVDPAGDSTAEKKHAEFVEDWLRLGLIEGAAFDILDAIGRGWSVHELTWTLAPGCNRITAMQWRPQRWFDVSYQDGETVLIRQINAEPAAASVPNGPVQPGFVAMPAHKFLVHKHKSWSGLSLRSGLTRTAAFLVMFKHFTSRDWGLFVQSYGLPLRIGKYGPSASAEERAILARAVFDLAGAAGAIIPESMQVDFIEPKHGAGSNDIHQRRCEWIDSQLSKLVLGQTGTSDSKQGAHASSSTHRLVQEDIERADARLISQTLQAQAIVPMIDLSFGVQPMGGYPRLHIGRPDETPIAEVSTAIQWMGPQGLTLRATELRQRMGFSEPEEGDEVVGGRAPVQPVLPAHDLPAETKPPEDLPGAAPPTTVPEAVREGEQQPEQTLHSQLGRVLVRHMRDSGPGLVEALSTSAARDCAAGFAALSRPAQAAFEHARSVDELRAHLEALKLAPDELADAIAQAMTVAELAGEATILEGLAQRSAHG